MAIRMTGMMSNLDTDSIIKEMMSAQSMKKTKIENKKTKLEWTMDKWKNLNAKIYGLYTGSLNAVKTAGKYGTKKVSSSNESVVTATGSKDAANGSHTIDVTKLASGQKVTGASLSGSVTKSTKLSDLGFTNGETIKVTAGTGSNAISVSLTVGGSTTVKDFLSTLQNAGLNASFDEGQQRFFISTKESGKDNTFSITSVNEDSTISNAKNDLLNELGPNSESVLNDFYNNYDKAQKNLKDKKDYYDSIMASGSGATTDEKVNAYDEWKLAEKGIKDLENNLVSYAEEQLKSSITETAKNTVITNYVNALKANTSSADHQAIVDAVDRMYYKYDAAGNKELPPTFTNETLDAAEASMDAKLRNQALTNINNLIASGTVYADEDAKQQAIENEFNSLRNTHITNAGGLAAAKENEANLMYNDTKESAFQSAGRGYANTPQGQGEIDTIVTGQSSQITAKGASVRTKITDYNTAITAAPASTYTNSLTNLGIGNIVIKSDGTVDTTIPNNNSANFHFDAAADAQITFDGAPLTSSSNNFSAAGISFEIKGVTTATGPITLSVTNNIEDSYEIIKNFVKQYNEVLTEMSTAYYAKSAKGYEPLTSEQKKAMSDDDIKNWENKIQDSLLRRDDTLGNLMNTMRSALQGSVTVDGKQYSLSSLGITTSDDWTERGLLHIIGDTEDTYLPGPGSTNKLQKALEADPELVGKIVTGITNNLYTTMQKKMSSSTLSSALKFYNDKQMSKQVDEYKDEIKAWEEKLQDMEDRYYKQFTAMEKALAKLNSQSSALSGLMGS